MFKKIFVKKYSSEQLQILWQCGEMVEVCSDCVGVCLDAVSACHLECKCIKLFDGLE